MGGWGVKTQTRENGMKRQFETRNAEPACSATRPSSLAETVNIHDTSGVAMLLLPSCCINSVVTNVSYIGNDGNLLLGRRVEVKRWNSSMAPLNSTPPFNAIKVIASSRAVNSTGLSAIP